MSWAPLRTILLVLLSFGLFSENEGYAKNDNVNIFYLDHGPKEGTPILMIQGLGAQLTYWPDELISLLQQNGYRPIVFDNRDAGLSDNFDEKGRPPFIWNYIKFYLNLPMRSTYSLEDMANDGVALLDHLQIEKAHIVGASMGGMIAQIMASKYPDRTASLVSLMSSPKIPTRSDISERNQDNLRNMENVETKDVQEYGFYPRAMPRQLTAIFEAGDRSDIVSNIEVPALVLHGEEDTLVPVKYGKLTSELIKNSRLKIYQNMGHNLPEEVIPALIGDIVSFYDEINEVL